jgi:hypothetical protein
VYTAEVKHGNLLNGEEKHITAALPGIDIEHYAGQAVVMGMNLEELQENPPGGGALVRGELFWSRKHPGQYLAARLLNWNSYVNTYLLQTNDEGLVMDSIKSAPGAIPWASEL